MAIIEIPFAGIYLVEHVGGGAIVHMAGGYIANTYIPAAVVEAFGVASGVLSQMGSSAGAIAGASTSALAHPLVLGTAAVAVIAVGTYCYFNGIPAPVEAALTSAGLGSATKQGFMVSLPQLAVALILLGGAGFLAFRFYRSYRSVKLARLLAGRDKAQTPTQAEETVRLFLGERAWTSFGSSVWSSAGELGDKAKKATRRSLNRGAARVEWVASLAGALSEKANRSLSNAAKTAADLVESAGEVIAPALQSASGNFKGSRQRAAAWLVKFTSKLRRKPPPVSAARG